MEKSEFIIPVEKWHVSFRYVYHNKGEYVIDHCIFKHRGSTIFIISQGM
ncbi:MAG: hypothetical protein NC824_00155 [Candidatus Omnitrophica bacterium]|nr:hypothetical protein [Candidatus Omnitrophota bacterium]